MYCSLTRVTRGPGGTLDHYQWLDWEQFDYRRGVYMFLPCTCFCRSNVVDRNGRS